MIRGTRAVMAASGATMSHEQGPTVRYPTRDGGGCNQAFYTLHEVRKALRDEVDRLQMQGDLKTETSRGLQIPDKTDLLNWLLVAVLGLPAADRDRLIRAGKRRFERLQESEPMTLPVIGAAGQGIDTAGQGDRPAVKGLGAREVKPRKDGGKGKHLAPVAMHAPGE